MVSKKVIFVILHYLAVDITIRCVNYIKQNMDTDSYQIVIVDNASPDKSYEVLEKKYGDTEYIDLIHNDKNLGFTKGNNIGIRFAREKYKFEFIIVLNNDAFILETALYHKLQNYYAKYHFAAAGPRVIDEFGTNFNPVSEKLPNRRKIDREMTIAKKMLWLDRFHLMVIYYRVGKLINRLQKINKIIRQKDDRKRTVMLVQENVVLHGCFWVFTPLFFSFYDGLADKKSMFVEEETLLYKLRKKNLKSLYIPDILIWHVGDVSTNAAYRSARQQLRFNYENILATWKEYAGMCDREGWIDE